MFMLSPQQIADGGLKPQAGDELVESRQIAFSSQAKHRNAPVFRFTAALA